MIPCVERDGAGGRYARMTRANQTLATETIVGREIDTRWVCS